MSQVRWLGASISAYLDYASQWDALVERAGYPVFLRSDFIAEALTSFGGADRRLLTAWDGHRLVAAAIVEQAGWQQWRLFQPSQLPLGPWVVAPGYSWSVLRTGLFRALPMLALSLGVTRQDPLFAQRPVDKDSCDVVDYIATSWMNVAGSFEQYRETLGKNLRQNLRKQRRRIEEQHGALEFSVAESTELVDCMFQDFARLEAAGWKGKENSAITLDNSQGQFYRAMLRRFAQRGQAFAWRLSCCGNAIAVDFGLRDDQNLVVLKTTYDENLKAFSPGQLLHENAFEHVFHASTTKRIEFYGETLEWHRRWTGQERTLFHVNAYRNRTVARVVDLARRFRSRRPSKGQAIA